MIMLANDHGLMGWVGLGQSADGLGWVGSHKMDPWTTLLSLLQFTTVCQFCVSAVRISRKEKF